jgi:hypothetical protein
MNAKFNKKNKDDFNKPVTLGLLLEFTDEFLLPRMADLFASKNDFKKLEGKVNKLGEEVKQLGEKVNRFEYNLKVYIDEKMTDYTSDIFKRLEKKYQQDLHFKQKIVALLKKHKIGSLEEISFLEGFSV